MLENAHLSEGVAVAKQRVTIADVAREAGTSTASVSYYLNDKREKLSEKTQNKIARVIKELGYVPNAQAQTLTGKQTHVIAIIILDNTNKWAGLVLNGMEQVMLPAGYQTVVCTSNFNPETELMYVDKMLSLGVDGFIIQPTANFKAVHDRIRRAGKPVVFFCRSGSRTQNKAELLERSASGKAYQLGGGILAWEQAGFPVWSIRELLPCFAQEPAFISGVLA